MRAAPTSRTAVPVSIWMLGFVSLLMDVSSEMILCLLPVFLVGTLGVSALVLGRIEGVSEATALIVKVFSGVASDRAGRRRSLALRGGSLHRPAAGDGPDAVVGE